MSASEKVVSLSEKFREALEITSDPEIDDEEELMSDDYTEIGSETEADEMEEQNNNKKKRKREQDYCYFYVEDNDRTYRISFKRMKKMAANM